MGGDRPRALTRRSFLKASALSAGAVAGGGILAACAAPASSPSSPAGTGAATQAPTSAPPASATPVTIEHWVWSLRDGFWDEKAALLREKFPNITVKITEVPYDGMYDRLFTALLSGSGIPDVIDIEGGNFPRFVSQAEVPLLPLQDRLATELGGLAPGIADRYSWDGQIYGVELAANSVVFFYRQDVFERAGVTIDTWEDFSGAAPALVEAAAALGSPGASAITWATDAQNNFRPLFLQRGGRYFDDSGQPTFNGAEGQDVANLMSATVRADQAVPTPGGWIGAPEWAAAAKEGKILSIVNGDWGTTYFQQNVPEMQGQWQVAPAPRWAAGGFGGGTNGGVAQSVMSTTQHPDESVEWLKVLRFDTDNVIDAYQRFGWTPVLNSALEDPRFAEGVPYFGAGYAEVIQTVLADMAAFPVALKQPEAERALDSVMPGIVTGDSDPVDALNQAAEQVNQSA